MGIKSSILGCASAIVGLTALLTPAVAQPALTSRYWNSNLSFNRCMDTTSAALKELGFTNSHTTTAVWGSYGDYSAQVICATSKGLIIVLVSGPDSGAATDHVQSIAQKIQNTR